MRRAESSGFLLIVSVLAISLTTAVMLVSDSGMLREWVLRLCSLGIFAMSLNLLVGYAGMLSFGHGVFFGIGAYSFGLLMQAGEVSIPTAIMATLVITAMFAAFIGWISVRLSGIYFSFITLAAQMLIYSLLISWSSLTGGEQGLIGGVPRPPFLGIDLSKPLHSYAFYVTFFVASITVMYRIVRSPFGVALRMIRDNPQRAIFLGVDVPRYRLAIFVIASLFASIAGMLMALQTSGAYPNFLYWTMSGEGLFMIMLGGVNVFLGPAVGAGLLIALDTLITGFAGAYHGLLLGSIILVMVLGLKRGVFEWLLDWNNLRRSQTASFKNKSV